MKMKFKAAAAAAVMIFVCTGCRAGGENTVIDGKIRKVCGWEKVYLISSPRGCSMAKFGCGEGKKIFIDSRGCGCAEPVLCEEQE